MRGRGIIAAIALAGAIAEANAGPDEVEQVRSLCMSQLNVPDAICDCLAGKAAEMTDDQQVFIVGTLEGDPAKVDSVRASLGAQEVMQATMFMVNQPSACARGE